MLNDIGWPLEELFGVAKCGSCSLWDLWATNFAKLNLNIGEKTYKDFFQMSLNGIVFTSYAVQIL